MKMLPCVAFIALLCLPLLAFAAPPSAVQSRMQAPKAVQAPTQAPTQAPLKTAQAGAGYRTYSYEPGAAGNFSDGGYSNGASIRRGTGHSYQNVTNKTLGRVN